MAAQHTPAELERIRDAAPELLAALQEMLRFTGDPWPSDDTPAAIADARAAIAKATGGKP